MTTTQRPHHDDLTDSRNEDPRTNKTPAWLLVTRREVMAKLVDKAFLLGTAVTVLMIAGFMGFQAWQSAKTSTYDVVVTPEAAVMGEALVQGAPEVDDSMKVSLEEVPDADAARQSLEDEEADAWLHPGDDGWVLTSQSSEESDLTRAATEVVRSAVLAENAASAGTTPEELQAGSRVTTDFLRGDAKQAQVAGVASFVFAFLFYLAALLFGMQLAGSVIEEKQSRIVEIIAAAIPVRHLLAGKVLGNTVLALVQVGLYAAVGLVGMAFTPYKDYVPALSGPVAWFIAFFVAGFIALACLWAVAGALASRTEDLQSTSTPLTFLMMAIFFSGLFLDGRWETVGSFVPPLSAVVMPKRILAGGVEIWEPILALALLAAFAAVTIAVGERIYRRALLQTGGRVSLKQAWSAPE